jgi:hypothetical protein
MARLEYRSSIARAAVVVALLSSRPAAAQVINPGPPQQPGGLYNDVITGVAYDRINQAMAEHRLQQLQEKQARDAQRCNSAAVDRDARRIENLRYRIVVDEWLIRINTLHDPGWYPYPLRLDPMSCAAIENAARPGLPPYYPQRPPSPGPLPRPIVPTFTVTIRNAEMSGDSIPFGIDGVVYRALPDSIQDLPVPPDSNIFYDSGGALGMRRYQLSAGRYEFRSTPEGLMLYKLPPR